MLGTDSSRTAAGRHGVVAEAMGLRERRGPVDQAAPSRPHVLGRSIAWLPCSKCTSMAQILAFYWSHMPDCSLVVEEHLTIGPFVRGERDVVQVAERRAPPAH